MEIQLHCLEQGQGEPLLLLHGNGEEHSYFTHQIPYFSRKYHVFALDTRGHGKSPRGTAPFSIRQFAEDLHDFMEEREIGQADILGFSDGGNIALTFALEHPEKVKRLVLNGANLHPGGVKRRVQLPIEAGWRIASLFGKRSKEARKHAELLGLMVKEPHIEPEALQRLAMPVLVIAGTRDMIRESHTRRIAESLPQGRLVLLEGDHFVAHKNPEAFNRAVEAFLEG